MSFFNEKTSTTQQYDQVGHLNVLKAGYQLEMPRVIKCFTLKKFNAQKSSSLNS